MLSIQQLNNGEKDLTHVADFATTKELVVTDRNGNTKPSLQGVIADLKAFNMRGPWSALTEYKLKDVVSYNGLAYAAVIGHISGAVFSVDSTKWAIYQGATLAELAGPNGAGLVGFKQKGLGSILSNLDKKLKETLCISDYGAIGDGSNATEAFIKTITEALKFGVFGSAVNPSIEIKIPAGLFLIDPLALSAAFTRPTSGILFSGQGWFTSVIRFANNPNSQTWMLEDSDKLQFAIFQNIGFEGCSPQEYGAGVVSPNSGFVRQNSTGTTQGYKFLSCRISGFDKVMLCEGSNTASENKFYNCKITHVSGYVLGLNNGQSLNHEFFGTDIEVVWGDFFKVFGAGGGSIKVFGGSFIPKGSGAILNLQAALSTHGAVFYGVRFELREFSTLINASSVIAGGFITFNGSSIYMTESTGEKLIVSIRAYRAVTFTECEFPTNGQRALYSLVEKNAYGESGRLSWINCSIPFDLSTAISIPDNHGHARAIDCISSNIGSISVEPFITAADFDLGGSNFPYGTSGGADSCFKTKKVWIKDALTIWPKSDGNGGSKNDLTVKLPAGAMIKQIVIKKEAAGSSFGDYQLQVSNGDKSIVHGTTNKDAQLYTHSLVLDNLFFKCLGDLNSRTVRISVTNASTGSQNITQGFGYIEYM